MFLFNVRVAFEAWYVICISFGRGWHGYGWGVDLLFVHKGSVLTQFTDYEVLSLVE